jgi:Amt family ammonium transporter
MGAMDFAGGLVVQVSGGVTALTVALVLGPRKGFPRLPMPPHNLPLTALGAGIIWVGWHGFSAGNAAVGDGLAGMAMLTTHIASAAAALTWIVIEQRRHGKSTLLGLLTGVVSGLAAISAGAGFVGPLGAALIGISASLVCFFSIQLIKNRLRIDDALDVFSVNGAAGVVGVLLTGVFAAKSCGGVGLQGEGGIAGQMAVQILALTVAAAWSGMASYGLLKLVAWWTPLRAKPEEETEGLDISQHGESAYNRE